MTQGAIGEPFIDIECVVKVPKYQNIIFQPDQWEVLKFAWVKYFSMFVFVYILLYEGFLGFVVRNKVFESVALSEFNVKSLFKK